MKKTAYIPTIGLEIHAELKTSSKMFCACANESEEDRPNLNVCPICMGHPGTLPVLNKEAIRHVILVGHAIGGAIADYTEWDRKNYFYPDIPKGYQISQYKYPLVKGGAVPIAQNRANGRGAGPLSARGLPRGEKVTAPASAVNGFRQDERGIAITRIHLEEDTAKSTHDAGEHSLIDFNRSGVPLLELVTEPVIHDAETAGAFARELQLLLRTLGVAEANMEKGELRVEANVSVASAEDTAAGRFGTKTEVKNLNSFRSVERAVAFEMKRQSDLLEKGQAVVQETRGWDESSGTTFSQRAKESSHDYRYFPEPDLPKLVISEIADFAPEKIKAGMPELPWEKRARFKKDFALTDKEAAMLVESSGLSSYFEAVIGKLAGDKKKVKLATNYLLTDYVGLLKKERDEDYGSRLGAIAPESFAGLIGMVEGGQVSSRGAKEILALMYAGDSREPSVIAQESGLVQKSDAKDLESAVAEIIAKNPAVVADYKSGKEAALQFLIGQGMKATKGSANPGLLATLFKKALA